MNERSGGVVVVEVVGCAILNTPRNSRHEAPCSELTTHAPNCRGECCHRNNTRLPSLVSASDSEGSGSDNATCKPKPSAGGPAAIAATTAQRGRRGGGGKGKRQGVLVFCSRRKLEPTGKVTFKVVPDQTCAYIPLAKTCLCTAPPINLSVRTSAVRPASGVSLSVRPRAVRQGRGHALQKCPSQTLPT